MLAACLLGGTDMAYASPRDLVAALRLNLASARTELDRLFAVPISRLVRAACRRCKTRQSTVNVFTGRAMRWLEMYLKSLSQSYLDSLDECDDPWGVFVAGTVFKAGQLLIYEPESGRTKAGNISHSDSLSSIESSENMPPKVRSDHYEAETFCVAHDMVSGDMIALELSQNTLWMLVADATGDSWPAYLIVRGVSSLWRTCNKDPQSEPRDLLAGLEEKILPHMPEGVFVEAVLGRFAPGGQAVICSAGGNSLILRVPQGAPAAIRQLPGNWLGLDIEPRDQKTLLLEGGGEVTFATDGLYDQPTGEMRLRDTILQALGRRPTTEPLHRGVVEVFEEARSANSQFDDVAIVSIRTTERVDKGQGIAQ